MKAFAVATLCLAVLAAGCSDSKKSNSAKPPTTSSTTVNHTSTTPDPFFTIPTTTTTLPIPEPPDTTGLSAFMFTSIPPGYVVSGGDSGPQTLQNVSDDDGGDDATAVLTSAGFISGFQRLWRKSENDAIQGMIYKFKDAAGAHTWAMRVQKAFDTAGTGEAHAVNVPGVADALGRGVGDAARSGTVIAFDKGPYVGQIAIVAPPGTDAPDALAVSLIQEMNSKLK
jgi:hypothetical protein